MVNQHDLLFSPFLVGFFHPFSVAVHQEGAIMLINLFTWRAEKPARADKSAPTLSGLFCQSASLGTTCGTYMCALIFPSKGYRPLRGRNYEAELFLRYNS